MKETKTEYIKNKISNLKDELANSYEKYKKEELISFIGFGLAASLTAMGVILGPNILLSAGTVTASIICHKYKNGKKYENYENRLNQEIKHLKGLNEGKYINKNARKSKISKLQEMINDQMPKEIKYNDAVTFTTASNILTAFSAISVYLNPLAVWLPIIGITANVITSRNEIKKHLERENLENKLNNLIYDLDVDAIIYNREEKEKTRQNNNKKEYNHENSYEEFNTLEHNTEKEAKPKTYYKR